MTELRQGNVTVLFIGYLERTDIVASFPYGTEPEDVFSALCPDQIEHLRDYGDFNIEHCDHCGEATWRDDSSFIDNVGVVCENCISEFYFFCEYLEEYVRDRDTLRTHNSETISQADYESNYFTCDCCGEIFHNDRYGQDGYCEYCFDSIDEDGSYDEYSGPSSKVINNYSYKPTPIFYGAENSLFMGVELEVEVKNDSKNDVADNIHNGLSEELRKKVYFKEDGSLSNGIEFVTHPMSLKEHTKFWPSFIETAKKSAGNSLRSHDTSTCGLHIHVARKTLDEGTINRLAMFLLVCQENLQIFARRKQNSYAEFLRPDNYKRDAKKNTDAKGRYCALNLGLENTIEFRFFKGTLKVETILASIDFTKLLVEFCQNKSSMNTFLEARFLWSRFLKMTKEKRSSNLNEYLESRGILTPLSKNILKAKKQLENEKKQLAVKAKKLEQAEQMIFEIAF